MAVNAQEDSSACQVSAVLSPVRRRSRSKTEACQFRAGNSGDYAFVQVLPVVDLKQNERAGERADGRTNERTSEDTGQTSVSQVSDKPLTTPADIVGVAWHAQCWLSMTRVTIEVQRYCCTFFLWLTDGTEQT